MEFYSDNISRLIEALSVLPGVGAKTAQRLAFHILNMSEEDVKKFADTIVAAKTGVHFCKECQTLTDTEICPICSNKDRDHSTIMVVENTRDLAAYEKTGEYDLSLIHI